MSLKRESHWEYMERLHTSLSCSQAGDDNGFEQSGETTSYSRVPIYALKPYVKLERISLNNLKFEETFKCKVLNIVPTLQTESKSKVCTDHLTKCEPFSSPEVETYDTKESLSKIKGSETNNLSLDYKSHNLTYPGTSSKAVQIELETKRLNPVVILERFPSGDTSFEINCSNFYRNIIPVMGGRSNVINDQWLPDSRNAESEVNDRGSRSNSPASDCTKQEPPTGDTSSEQSEYPSQKQLISTTNEDRGNITFAAGQRKSNLTPTLYTCQQCGKAYIWKTTLNRHLISHTGIKAYVCDHCDKSFGLRGHLINHLELHTGTKSMKCEHCGKLFNTIRNLRRHLLIHSGITEYICDYCGKSFRQKGSLKHHLLSHLGLKPYKCEYCGKSFALKASLSNHLNIHRDVKAYTCDRCGKIFRYKSNLMSHLKMHTGIQAFPCEHCGKSYRSERYLRQHLIIHGATRKFSCEQCGKSFFHKRNLKYHFIQHSNLKTFACDSCGKLFCTSTALRVHLLTHTGVKAYQCPLCDKSFALKGNLTKHSVIHTGIKAFTCCICSKSFRNKSSAKKHIKIH